MIGNEMHGDKSVNREMKDAGIGHHLTQHTVDLLTLVHQIYMLLFRNVFTTDSVPKRKIHQTLALSTLPLIPPVPYATPENLQNLKISPYP